MKGRIWELLSQLCALCQSLYEVGIITQFGEVTIQKAAKEDLTVPSLSGFFPNHALRCRPLTLTISADELVLAINVTQ